MGGMGNTHTHRYVYIYIYVYIHILGALDTQKTWTFFPWQLEQKQSSQKKIKFKALKVFNGCGYCWFEMTWYRACKYTCRCPPHGGVELPHVCKAWQVNCKWLFRVAWPCLVAKAWWDMLKLQRTRTPQYENLVSRKVLGHRDVDEA